MLHLIGLLVVCMIATAIFFTLLSGVIAVLRTIWDRIFGNKA